MAIQWMDNGDGTGFWYDDGSGSDGIPTVVSSDPTYFGDIYSDTGIDTSGFDLNQFLNQNTGSSYGDLDYYNPTFGYGGVNPYSVDVGGDTFTINPDGSVATSSGLNYSSSDLGNMTQEQLASLFGGLASNTGGATTPEQQAAYQNIAQQDLTNLLNSLQSGEGYQNLYDTTYGNTVNPTDYNYGGQVSGMQLPNSISIGGITIPAGSTLTQTPTGGWNYSLPGATQQNPLPVSASTNWAGNADNTAEGQLLNYLSSLAQQQKASNPVNNLLGALTGKNFGYDSLLGQLANAGLGGLSSYFSNQAQNDAIQKGLNTQAPYVNAGITGINYMLQNLNKQPALPQFAQFNVQDMTGNPYYQAMNQQVMDNLTALQNQKGFTYSGNQLTDAAKQAQANVAQYLPQFQSATLANNPWQQQQFQNQQLQTQNPIATYLAGLGQASAVNQAAQLGTMGANNAGMVNSLAGYLMQPTQKVGV